MTRPRHRVGGKRTGQPGYALVTEATPPPPGDVDDEGRKAAIARSLERAGGRRIGDVVRVLPYDTRRLALWATRDRSAFITFDGAFVEALTLLDDGRAILTTDTFKTEEAAETVVRRHTNAVTSACKRSAAKPVMHDDEETWLATHERLTPERARRDRIVDAVVRAITLAFVVGGVALALYLRPSATSSRHAIAWIVEFALLGGVAGAVLSAFVGLPVRRVKFPLRLPRVRVPDEGAYRTPGKRPHVRIAASGIDQPGTEDAGDNVDGEYEDPVATAKQRLDPR